MLGLSILSLALMTVDHFTDYLDPLRSTMTMLVTPIVVAADLPKRTADGLSELLRTREQMRSHIAALEHQMLLLRAKTEKMASLSAENDRLRKLLGSASKLQDDVLVAEIIGIDPDPDRQEVIVDKGTADGAFVGQPVLDAEGLMGQVIRVSRYTSRVLLITDVNHSVPVQVVRSNVRLIARGTGTTQRLELMHVQDTADIRVGDLLVSSGLGGRFPVGYPVGIVNHVEHDPGKPFAAVTATPSAHLDRSRYVLLVFTEHKLAGHTGKIRRRSGG